jgi:hypothetical protein
VVALGKPALKYMTDEPAGETTFNVAPSSLAHEGRV